VQERIGWATLEGIAAGVVSGMGGTLVEAPTPLTLTRARAPETRLPTRFIATDMRSLVIADFSWPLFAKVRRHTLS